MNRQHIKLSHALLIFTLLAFMQASKSSPTSIPTGITYYVPINLINNQSAQTVVPFQQPIKLDSRSYATYIAGNLQNLEFFYSNGTVINSWLESGNSNTLTNSSYWLKLTAPVPANANATVYLGFASISTSLFNNYDVGEAPQLSSSYAQYDDGANVFNFYENFAGSSINTSRWTQTGSVSINNGLTIPSGATDSYIKTAPTYSPVANILEVYWNAVTVSAGVLDFGFQSVGDVCNSNMLGWYMIPYSSSSQLSGQNAAVGALGPGCGIITDHLQYAGNTIFGLGAGNASHTSAWIGDINTAGFGPYNESLGASYAPFTGGNYISLENNLASPTGVSLQATWIRMRAFPLGGFAPVAHFGQVYTQSGLTENPYPFSFTNRTVAAGLLISVANTVASGAIAPYKGSWTWTPPTSSGISQASTTLSSLPSSSNTMSLNINVISATSLKFTFGGSSYYANTSGGSNVFGVWNLTSYIQDSTGANSIYSRAYFYVAPTQNKSAVLNLLPHNFTNAFPVYQFSSWEGGGITLFDNNETTWQEQYVPTASEAFAPLTVPDLSWYNSGNTTYSKIPNTFEKGGAGDVPILLQSNLTFYIQGPPLSSYGGGRPWVANVTKQYPDLITHSSNGSSNPTKLYGALRVDDINFSNQVYADLLNEYGNIKATNTSLLYRWYGLEGLAEAADAGDYPQPGYSFTYIQAGALRISYMMDKQTVLDFAESPECLSGSHPNQTCAYLKNGILNGSLSTNQQLYNLLINYHASNDTGIPGITNSSFYNPGANQYVAYADAEYFLGTVYAMYRFRVTTNFTQHPFFYIPSDPFYISPQYYPYPYNTSFFKSIDWLKDFELNTGTTVNQATGIDQLVCKGYDYYDAVPTHNIGKFVGDVNNGANESNETIYNMPSYYEQPECLATAVESPGNMEYSNFSSAATKMMQWYGGMMNRIKNVGNFAYLTPSLSASHTTGLWPTNLTLVGNSKYLLAWFYTNSIVGDTVRTTLDANNYNLGSKWIAIDMQNMSVIAKGNTTTMNLAVRVPPGLTGYWGTSAGWSPLFIMNQPGNLQPLYENMNLTSYTASSNSTANTSTYKFVGPHLFSSWLIAGSNSKPSSVKSNLTGTLSQYATLGALNSSIIGFNCTSINADGTCGRFANLSQQGWYYDSVNKLLYVHFRMGSPVSIKVVQPFQQPKQINITLLTPTNNSQTGSPVNFQWKFVDNSSSTRTCTLYIDSNVTFTNNACSNTTVSQDAVVLATGKHTWQVQVQNSQGTSSISALQTFQVTSGSGGSSGGSGGGGGGGPSGPVIIPYTIGNRTGYIIKNLSLYNSATVKILNKSFSLTQGQININSTSEIVNTKTYILYKNTLEKLNTSNTANWYLQLNNISYLPIQQLASVNIYAQTNSPAPITTSTTSTTTTRESTLATTRSNTPTSSYTTTTVSAITNGSNSTDLRFVGYILLVAAAVIAGLLGYNTMHKPKMPQPPQPPKSPPSNEPIIPKSLWQQGSTQSRPTDTEKPPEPPVPPGNPEAGSVY